MGWHSPTRLARILLRALPAGLALLLGGCLAEPERSNPVDPGNPDYTENGTLLVQVQNFDDEPIEGAWVRPQGFDVAQQTDVDGTASFNFPAGNYLFEATKDGFSTSLASAQVLARQSRIETITLNGLPSIDRVEIITALYENLDDGSRYTYQMTVEMSDPDDPLDLGVLSILEPGAPEPYPIARGESILYEPQGWPSLAAFSQLLGKPFLLTVPDRQAAVDSVYFDIRNFFYYPQLTREMVTDSDDLDINEPTLLWNNVESTDFITFPPREWRLRVLRTSQIVDELIDTMIVFEDTPLPNEFSFTIPRPDTLQLNTYYDWDLRLFDPYGNFIQTERKRFRIVNNDGD